MNAPCRTENDAMDHQHMHLDMVQDFKRRFLVCSLLTAPVLLLSIFPFSGSSWLQFAGASVIFFYGGAPFFKGLFAELTQNRPGMMTLVATALFSCLCL